MSIMLTQNDVDVASMQEEIEALRSQNQYLVQRCAILRAQVNVLDKHVTESETSEEGPIESVQNGSESEESASD